MARQFRIWSAATGRRFQCGRTCPPDTRRGDLRQAGRIRKRRPVAALHIVLVSLLPAFAASEEINLDGEWEFTYRHGEQPDTPELPDAAAYDITLPVPDYWRFHADRYVKAAWWPALEMEPAVSVGLYGTGFYRKRIDVPSEWANRSVRLVVGRGNGRVNVWLNDNHLAYFPFAPFFPSEVEFGTNLIPGRSNELVLSVNNAKPLSRRERHGGIGSSLSLMVSGSKGHIDEVFIRESEDLRSATGETHLRSPFPDAAFAASRLEWRIREAGTAEALAEGSIEVAPFERETRVEWRMDTGHLEPWHPNHPHLYRAELTWKTGDGKVLDRCVQRFGLRKWSYHGRKLYLNGKPIYIRQRYTGPQLPPHWGHPPSKDYWLKFFRLCKEVGYNSVDHYSTPSPQELEAADEVGIIMQCAAGKVVAQFRWGTQKVLQIPGLWEGIVHHTRPYPSMSILYYGGEMDWYDGFMEDIARVSAMVHAENPRVLAMPNHAMKGIDYVFSDEDFPELKHEPFTHHPARLAEVTKHSDIFGHYHSGIFSYNSFSGSWRAFDKELEIYDRPLIAHEPPCLVQARAPYPADGKLETIAYGVRDAARQIAEPLFGEAEFRKFSSHPRQDDLYRVSGHKYALAMKYIIEKIRKCGNLAGYEQLVGGDGWMFDQFNAWRPGNTLEKVLKYNNESILMLDWDDGRCHKRDYWEGDRFEGTMMVSFYGENGIEGGKLDWTVSNAATDEILLRGEKDVGRISTGEVTALGKLQFDWPGVAANGNLSLSMQLSGSGYDIRNDWDFWIFKDQPPKRVKALATYVPFRLLHDRHPGIVYMKEGSEDRSDALWIVEALTEHEIERLESGRDLLLLGSDPFPLHTKWTRFQPGETQSNVGSAVHDHPIFDRIPHEGWGDWQFAPVTAAAVLFEGMEDLPFDPILEPVQYEGRYPQAMIFEYRVGPGRLFVATCRFRKDSPVGVTLLDSILGYVTGPDFSPRSRIEPAPLRNLLDGTGAE